MLGKTVYMLASVLDASVHLEVRNEIDGKVRLAGPVGELLSQDKIPTKWELVDFEIPCGGKFGTVKALAKIPPTPKIGKEEG